MKKTLLFAAMAALAMGASLWGQTITVTSPGAGDDWCLGSTHAINWTSSGVAGNVMIVLRPADQPMSEAVLTIAASTANDGSFSWAIPGSGLAAGTYEVRVRTVTTDPFVYGDSANFTISSCPAPSASITVTSPNATSKWERGTGGHQIQWSSTGVTGNVMTVLRPADSPMADPVLTIAASTANDGSYYWNVPDTVDCGFYEIRVRTVSSDPFIFGDSANFEITGTVHIDPSILEKLMKMRYMIKFPIDPNPPDPPWWEIDFRDFYAAMHDKFVGNIFLFKNGQKFQEVGRFGFGKGRQALPNKLRGQLSRQDFKALRTGAAKFSLGIFDAQGKLLQEIPLEVQQGLQQKMIR
jgi:hypothetical protein